MKPQSSVTLQSQPHFVQMYVYSLSNLIYWIAFSRNLEFGIQGAGFSLELDAQDLKTVHDTWKVSSLMYFHTMSFSL